MNSVLLEKAIEERLEALRELRQRTQTDPQPWLRFKADLGLERERLARVLAEQEEFRAPVNFSDGFGYGVISLENIAAGLMLAAADFGAATAVRHLREALYGPARLTINALVWGVRVTAKQLLSDQVHIMPLEDLGPSTMRADVEDELSRAGWDPFGLRTDSKPAVLQVGIAYDGPLRPAGAVVDQESAWRWVDVLRQFALALTVVGPCSPMLGYIWTQFEEPSFEMLRSGQGFDSPHHEVRPQFLKSSEIDVQAAAPIVEGFIRLNAQFPALGVATERLNQALRRRLPGDSAVDVSTAFECLLIPSGESELNYRLGLRAARILGPDLDSRKKIRKILRAFYKLRSETVHGGSPKPSYQVDGEQQTPERVAGSGIALCADLILDYIRRGSVPDWDQVELG